MAQNIGSSFHSFTSSRDRHRCFELPAIASSRREALGVVRNTIADYWRRRYRQAKMEGPTEGIVDGHIVPADESLMWKERRRQLRVAISCLPKIQKQTVLAHVIEEVPYKVIAQAQGISVGAARKNFSRGLKTLRKVLGQWRPSSGKPE